MGSNTHSPVLSLLPKPLVRISTQAGYFLIGPTAGYMATLALGWTAAACGGLMFLLVPATILFLHEQRMKIPSRELLDNARTQLVKIGAATTMWLAAGLMTLFYIAPDLSTALFYKQQNELHLNTQPQGYLQVLVGGFGLVAALAMDLSLESAHHVCRVLAVRDRGQSRLPVLFVRLERPH